MLFSNLRFEPHPLIFLHLNKNLIGNGEASYQVSKMIMWTVLVAYLEEKLGKVGVKLEDSSDKHTFLATEE